MDDASHLQVYRRFFAVLSYTLPGLALFLGMVELFMFILGDVIELDFGWSIGITAIIVSILLVVWLIIGVSMHAWALRQKLGPLIGIAAASLVGLLVVAIVFLVSVGNAAEERERAEARASQNAALVVYDLDVRRV